MVRLIDCRYMTEILLLRRKTTTQIKQNKQITFNGMMALLAISLVNSDYGIQLQNWNW